MTLEITIKKENAIVAHIPIYQQTQNTIDVTIDQSHNEFDIQVGSDLNTILPAGGTESQVLARDQYNNAIWTSLHDFTLIFENRLQ